MSDTIERQMSIEEIRSRLLNNPEVSWSKDHEQRITKLENAVRTAFEYIYELERATYKGDELLERDMRLNELKSRSNQSAT
jgi:hypothetical protein